MNTGSSHYGPRVHSVVDVMAKRLVAQFNTIHVRSPTTKFPGSGLYRAATVPQMYHYMLPQMRNIGVILIHLEEGYKLVFASNFS